MQGKVAANPQTKSTNLGCESTHRLLPRTLAIAIYYYYLVPELRLILLHHGGGGLSRPKFWIQHVPKTAYCRKCRHKE